MSSFLSASLGNIGAFFLIVLFFGSSIFVHELGHFLAARRRGVKVVRFSIGFGPAIFAWKGKDGVEYRLSWIPIGGYVALPQLADMAALEGDSGEVEKLPPVTYGTKVLVFVAGAVFNVIFALVLSTILWVVGRPEPENVTSTRIGYVSEKIALLDKTIVQSPASKAGLKVGDTIIEIDHVPVRSWMDVLNQIVLGTQTDQTGERVSLFTVEREGVRMNFTVNPVRTTDERVRKVGIDAAYAVIVKDVEPNTPGAQIGFAAGDRIEAIDGNKVWGVPSFSTQISPTKGVHQDIMVLREGREVHLPYISPGNGADGANSFRGIDFTTNWQLLYQTPFAQVKMILSNTFQTFGALLNPRGDVGLSNLSGFIGIGRGFWDALNSDYPAKFVIWFTVMINISLAFFNLLPIPVLDGGHITLATIAKLRGRPLPASFIMTTQSVFVVLLLMMMLYVTVFGDVRRLISDFRSETQNRPAAEAPKKALEPAKP